MENERESKEGDNKVDERTITTASAKVVTAGRNFYPKKQKERNRGKEKKGLREKSQDPNGVPVNLVKYRTWKAITQISIVTMRERMHSGTNF